MIHSDIATYNDCEAFRNIVKGGNPNLPFIIEKLKSGDFFMNQAMSEITKVDIAKVAFEKGWRKKGLEGMVGAQGESIWWLKWWAENRDQYMNDPRTK